MRRRQFVKQSVISGFALNSPFAEVLVRSSERKYRTVLIGAGWWGNNILGEAMQAGVSRFVGVCDVDETFLAETAARIEKNTGDLPAKYIDYRELLDDLKPEIVIIATPEHWHALMAIEALKHGCHIYLEKPICHTINEGRAIVAAAEKYGGIIQVGLHRRVSPHIVKAQQLIREGRIGEVKMIRPCVYSPTPDDIIENQPAPPENMHWDLYIGPAADQPYAPSIHPRGFRRFLNFTNGVIGDWGVHWMDQILWWSEEKYPRKIFSNAFLVDPDCGYDAPDVQTATFEFESFSVNWEHRRLGGDQSEKHEVGTYFYGTKGVAHLGWLEGSTIYPEKEGEIIRIPPEMHEPDYQNIRELWADFINAIEKKSMPVAGIESSHRATTMSLLAMISMKTGRVIEWDGEREMILNDPEANSLMARTYRDPWKYPSIIQ